MATPQTPSSAVMTTKSAHSRDYRFTPSATWLAATEPGVCGHAAENVSSNPSNGSGEAAVDVERLASGSEELGGFLHVAPGRVCIAFRTV